MKCGKCNECVSVESDSVSCVTCMKKFHFECSVREVKWRNMTAEHKNSWSCTTCKSVSSIPRTNSASSSLSDADNPCTQGEDASTKTLLLRMNARLDTLDEVKKAVNGMSASLEYLSGKYDELLTEIKGYKEENKKLNKEVELLKAESAEKDKRLCDLTKRFNALEQYGRGVNLEVHGVEITDGENAEYIAEHVAKAIGVTYNAAEIQAAHRLPSRDKNYDRPPLFLIQFVSKQTKQKWLHFARKKKLFSRDVVGEGNGRVYVNENLTPYYSRLLREAKKIAKEKDYQFVWVLNGTIRVKKRDNSRKTLVISCEEDLKEIV